MLKDLNFTFKKKDSGGSTETGVKRLESRHKQPGQNGQNRKGPNLTYKDKTGKGSRKPGRQGRQGRTAHDLSCTDSWQSGIGQAVVKVWRNAVGMNMNSGTAEQWFIVKCEKELDREYLLSCWLSNVDAGLNLISFELFCNRLWEPTLIKIIISATADPDLDPELLMTKASLYLLLGQALDRCWDRNWLWWL